MCIEMRLVSFCCFLQPDILTCDGSLAVVVNRQWTEFIWLYIYQSCIFILSI